MKKINFPALLTAMLLSILFAQEAQVTNVLAAQRTDGSQIVDITYDLTEDALFNRFTITVEVSFDGGGSFSATDYVTGEVGNFIAPGTSKMIAWDLGQEYDDLFSENVRVKVIATGHVIGEIPFEFVTVPAGEFYYGYEHLIITIDYDYEIMKYEVTNAQYAQYLIETVSNGIVWIQDDTVVGHYPGDEQYSEGDYLIYNMEFDNVDANVGMINWNGTTFIVNEGYGNHPVINITWFGAYAFADYYGMQLPTEIEWVKAVSHENGHQFPWGEYGSTDGTRANFWFSGDPWDNGTTPTGFYNGENYAGFQTADSPSRFGTYDMNGNVYEWTNSWNDWYHVIRGGSWQTSTWLLMNQEWIGADPAVPLLDLGFRCIRIEN